MKDRARVRAKEKRIHIVTVGASIAENARRKGIVEVRSLDELEELLRRKPSSINEFFEKFRQALEENPREFSAELNAMWSFIEKGKIDYAYLLHSDTKIGELCAKVLMDYLRSKKIRASMERIDKLGDPNEFRYGIAELGKRIHSLIKKEKENRVYVCATGGFKPETAIATLVANIEGVPTYYIHEYFKEHIAIPGFPVKWMTDLTKEERDMIIWLWDRTKEGRMISKEEFIHKYSQDMLEKFRDRYWLLEEKDGKILPSPILDLIILRKQET